MFNNKSIFKKKLMFCNVCQILYHLNNFCHEFPLKANGKNRHVVKMKKVRQKVVFFPLVLNYIIQL